MCWYSEFVLTRLQKDFKYLDKLMWEESIPTINTCVKLGDDVDETRESDPLDGYEILSMPENSEWA